MLAPILASIVPLAPFSHTLDRLLSGETVGPREMEAAIGRILDGESSPTQIAALLVALRAKGEHPDEIAAAARALRSRMKPCPFSANDGVPVLDTCGTGGDGASSFNVSTVAAIVVAACGVIVAKHGNRAVSSRSGSADLIEALDVPIAPPPGSSDEEEALFDAALERSLRQAHIAFLFAPRHHAALRHAAAVRKELGVRTMFNLLGPLANPARATHQLLGVYDDRLRGPLAAVLGALGLQGAWVVHGEACEGAPRGLDEVSPAGPTRVTVLRADGTREERVVTPEEAGLPRVSLASLAGGDASHNAAVARSVLSGAAAGDAYGPRIAVVLNAACALVVAGAVETLHEGRLRAEAALDDGAARATLDRWRTIMNEGGPPEAA